MSIQKSYYDSNGRLKDEYNIGIDVVNNIYDIDHIESCSDNLRIKVNNNIPKDEILIYHTNGNIQKVKINF